MGVDNAYGFSLEVIMSETFSFNVRMTDFRFEFGDVSDRFQI